MLVISAFPLQQNGEVDLELCWAEADLPVEMASIVGALSFGTAAIVLRVYGVSVHLMSPKRGILLVVDSVVGLWSRLGYPTKSS